MIAENKYSLMLSFLVEPIDDFNKYVIQISDKLNAIPEPFSFKKRLDLSAVSSRAGSFLSKSLRGFLKEGSENGEIIIEKFRTPYMYQKRDTLCIDFSEHILRKINFDVLFSVCDNFATDLPLIRIDLVDNDFKRDCSAVFAEVKKKYYEYDAEYGNIYGVSEFHLAHYWSTEFCMRTFGLTSEDVHAKLAKLGFESAQIGNGILFSALDFIESRESLIEVNRKLRLQLGGRGFLNE